MKHLTRLLSAAALLVLLCLPAAAASSKKQPATSQPLDASLTIQTASPSEPTATAVLSFENLPRNYSRPGTVVWYRNGVQYSEPQPVLVQRGEIAYTRITVCFSADTPASNAITAVLTCGEEQWTYTGTLNIQNYDAAHYARLAALAKPYRITVSRFQNIVIVWAQAADGTYSLLQNMFLCSTGKATPRGTFRTGEHLRWHTLFGSKKTNWNYVYGQYVTRITDNILFHTVPYYTKNPNDLEYDEYNLLGTRASMGCIRLTVEASKWIYDNIPAGTEVEMIDELETLPASRPAAPTIDQNDPRRVWDPTDPLPNNPWLPASSPAA